MNTLTPPCQLACPENQSRIDYVLNLVNQKDFDFPTVSSTLLHLRSLTFNCSLFPSAFSQTSCSVCKENNECRDTMKHVIRQ